MEGEPSKNQKQCDSLAIKHSVQSTEVLIIFLIYKDQKDKGIWKKNCVQVERLNNTRESFIAREGFLKGRRDGIQSKVDFTWEHKDAVGTSFHPPVRSAFEFFCPGVLLAFWRVNCLGYFILCIKVYVHTHLTFVCV